MSSHRRKSGAERDRADPWADVQAGERPSQTTTDLPSPDAVASDDARPDPPADD